MKGFTYFESYRKATRHLPDEMRLALHDAVEDYMFDDVEPSLDAISMCCFELMRPTLDISKKRATAGATKSNEIKTKQNKSKRNQTKSNEIKVKTSSPKEKDKEKDKEMEKDMESNDSCAERSDDHAAPPVITMPLVDGSEHNVTQADVDEYQNLYPGVNVMQELRNMRGWCLDNPTRRKTRSGVKRFIGGWLSKEQNKARGRPESKNPFNTGIRQEYDYQTLRQQFVVNG